MYILCKGLSFHFVLGLKRIKVSSVVNLFAHLLAKFENMPTFISEIGIRNCKPADEQHNQISWMQVNLAAALLGPAPLPPLLQYQNPASSFCPTPSSFSTPRGPKSAQASKV
jgi:hypothetical protein